MEIVYLIIGLSLGIALGWLIGRARTSSAQATILAEQEKTKALLAQSQELKNDLEVSRAKIIDLTTSLSATEADFRNLEEKLEERKNEIGELQEKFAAQFKNLANDIF